VRARRSASSVSRRRPALWRGRGFARPGPPRRPGSSGVVTWLLLGECAVYRYEEGAATRVAQGGGGGARSASCVCASAPRRQPLGLRARCRLARSQGGVRSAEGRRLPRHYGQAAAGSTVRLVRTIPDAAPAVRRPRVGLAAAAARVAPDACAWTGVIRPCLGRLSGRWRPGGAGPGAPQRAADAGGSAGEQFWMCRARWYDRPRCAPSPPWRARPRVSGLRSAAGPPEVSPDLAFGKALQAR